MLTSISAYTAPVLIQSLHTFPSNYLSQKVSQLALPLINAASTLYFAGLGGYEMSVDDKTCYSQSHGLLFLGTGIACGISTLHSLKYIHLDRFISPINVFGNTCFFLANIIALDENIRLYMELDKQGNDDETSRLLKKSYVMGMINTLGYIVMAALAAFGASTSVVIVVGILSSCFGGLKILCDMINWLKGASKESPAV